MATAPLDDALQIRHAGADLLSLALIDARNHTLRWLAAFDDEASAASVAQAGGRSPSWLAGHAGWYQEHWIARNLQRQRGEHCDVAGPRLASVEPRAEAWFTDAGQGTELDASTLRAYLADTLETTLELLAAAGAGDDDLHFYRLSLLHEDRLGERLVECAAAAQLPMQPPAQTPAQPPAGGAAPPPWLPVPARPAREALWVPAQRLRLGSTPGGLVPDNERWAHEVDVPEFEIDAQAVSWARYIEFAEDGGYDRRELWSDAGWTQLQAEGRRAPRHVEQLRGGVLLHRQGRLQRVAPSQPAMHITRFEAEAWCRWAGRRLPAEPEWELAALSAASRGFVWGDVFEWVAGSARAWPGHAPTPGTLDAMPAPGSQGVLRGASWMSRQRCRHPRARRFAPPAFDAAFSGFRSCAV